MKQQEHYEQAAVMAWARLAEPRYPELALLFAVPNGGLRNKATAARLKAEGVKAGVPDLWLPVARGGYHGLVIVQKAGKGRPTAQGWLALVCVGARETIAALERYLQDRPAAAERIRKLPQNPSLKHLTR